MSVNKQEYLKRYLENKNSGQKRKKKSKTCVSRLKIVDENIDLKCINFGDKAYDDDDDEAPVIAEVIDERPLEVKLKELYESSRWKKIDSNENSQCDPSVTAQISLFENKGSGLTRTRHDSSSDISPPRCQSLSKTKSRHDSDSDISPPRSSKQNNSKRKNSDISPPGHRTDSGTKQKHSSSDISPPRHNSGTARSRQSSSDISPPRRLSEKVMKSRYDSDSDISPPPYQRKMKSNKPENSSSLHAKNKIYRKDTDSDSDFSPPRAKSPNKSVETSIKPGKTLSGLKAGLQSSETLKKETQELRKREKAHINMLDDDVSGRNADTIVRDRKTGKKRDLQREKKMKDEENKKLEEHQQKYAQWGKGIEQEQNKINKFEEDVYEMSKPLQRYRDDEDLDNRLKSIIHAEDPMANYVKKKMQKNVPSVPTYNGPPAPPNRFNIPPGYRWDGVDRSNGFESKYFENINKKKAVEQDAYLWSVQEM